MLGREREGEKKGVRIVHVVIVCSRVGSKAK